MSADFLCFLVAFVLMVVAAAGASGPINFMCASFAALILSLLV